MSRKLSPVIKAPIFPLIIVVWLLNKHKSQMRDNWFVGAISDFQIPIFYPSIIFS